MYAFKRLQCGRVGFRAGDRRKKTICSCLQRDARATRRSSAPRARASSVLTGRRRCYRGRRRRRRAFAGGAGRRRRASTRAMIEWHAQSRDESTLLFVTHPWLAMLICVLVTLMIIATLVGNALVCAAVGLVRKLKQQPANLLRKCDRSPSHLTAYRPFVLLLFQSSLSPSPTFASAFSSCRLHSSSCSTVAGCSVGGRVRSGALSAGDRDCRRRRLHILDDVRFDAMFRFHFEPVCHFCRSLPRRHVSRRRIMWRRLLVVVGHRCACRRLQTAAHLLRASHAPPRSSLHCGRLAGRAARRVRAARISRAHPRPRLFLPGVLTTAAAARKRDAHVTCARARTSSSSLEDESCFWWPASPTTTTTDAPLACLLACLCARPRAYKRKDGRSTKKAPASRFSQTLKRAPLARRPQNRAVRRHSHTKCEKQNKNSPDSKQTSKI